MNEKKEGVEGIGAFKESVEFSSADLGKDLVLELYRCGKEEPPHLNNDRKVNKYNLLVKEKDGDDWVKFPFWDSIHNTLENERTDIWDIFDCVLGDGISYYESEKGDAQLIQDEFGYTEVSEVLRVKEGITDTAEKLEEVGIDGNNIWDLNKVLKGE